MRTPITLKIKFKSSSLDQFIERYSVDVSRGGIFIRTKEPLPVGTTLRFEFQLQDSSSLIGGEGTVVWNRAYDPARTGVAPGMGVRFDKLTADSQRVLERILSEKHKRGEAQLESRFDAGVRASRESRSHEFPDAGTPLPAPVPGMGMSSSPGVGSGSFTGGGRGGGGDGFGDEPTRMMAAEQMSQLAQDMQSAEDFAQDQPTRRATLDEIRRAVSATETGQAPARTGSTGEQTRLRSGAVSQTLPRGMTPSAASAASKMTSAMGVVDPRLAAGTQPTSSSADFPMPPSLSTRQVSDAEAAALIAASASTNTPPSQILPIGGARDERTPPRILPDPAAGAYGQASGGSPPGRAAATPRAPHDPSAVEVAERPTVLGIAPPPLPGAREASGVRPLADAAAAAATIVDAPVPPLPPSVPAAGGPGHSVAQTISSPPPAESLDFLAAGHGHPGSAEPAGPSPSGISIGLDFDGPGEATSPSAPLDPSGFAPISSSPPPPARDPKVEVARAQERPAEGRGPAEPPKTEATTGKVKVSAPISPPPGERGRWRTPVQVVVLLGAVVLGGAGIYALLFKGKGDDPPPPITQPQPPAERVPVEKAPEDRGPKPDPDKVAPEKADPDKAAPEKAGPDKAAPEKAGPDKTGPKPGTDTARKPDGEKKPAAGDKAGAPVVSVSSDPPGARVELNGKAVGETPVETGEVQAGKTYDVKLSLRGYQDARFKLKAAPGERVAKVVKLTPYERVVEVNSNPRGADLFVDGKRVGRTPFTLKRLDMSKIHEIEVRKTGYGPQTAKVADTDTFDVKGGREVRTLNLTLEAQPGAAPPKAEPAQPRHETKRPAVKEGEPGKGETKPEARPEGKPEGKGDTKPEARPEGRPEGKGDTKPEARPETKPEEGAPEGQK